MPDQGARIVPEHRFVRKEVKRDITLTKFRANPYCP